MSILRLCYEWGVLTALAAVGAGVFVFAPGLVAVAVPLLLLAACPLSMLVRMRAMDATDRHAAPNAPAAPDRMTAARSELADLDRRREELVQQLEYPEVSAAAQPVDPPPAPALRRS